MGQKNLGQKKLGGGGNLGGKKMLGKNFFGVGKNVWEEKNVLGKKMCGEKKFWGKKLGGGNFFWGEGNLGEKNLGPNTAPRSGTRIDSIKKIGKEKKLGPPPPSRSVGHLVAKF